MTQARAIVFDAPQTLSVQSLELEPFEAADLDVEVNSSGIGTGTERLPWDGTMPPFSGLGYPLVPGLINDIFEPGRTREGYEVAFGDSRCLKTMFDRQA